MRRRLEALEERASYEARRIRAEAARRIKAIGDLLTEADLPGAVPEVRARAARVRELMEIAERRAQREPWKGTP